MGVCLIASKSLKKVEIEKEIKGSTYWDLFPPVHKYVTTIMVTLDSREGHQYHIIWAYDYPEAWKSLFEVWGDNIVPDNQRLLEHDSDRRALRR